MLKSLFTLARGANHDAHEGLKNQTALKLLQQQIRDASSGIHAAKHALAISIAETKKEDSNLKRLNEKLSELEGRAVKAIEQDQSELALEAAEAIAIIEDEHKNSSLAHKALQHEIKRQKNTLQLAESRLRELQRGLRLARAGHETNRLGSSVSRSTHSNLREAEDTLKRVQKNQTLQKDADEALAELENDKSADELNRKLAHAGCGKPITTTGEDVLARLSKKARRPAQTTK